MSDDDFWLAEVRRRQELRDREARDELIRLEADRLAQLNAQTQALVRPAAPEPIRLEQQPEHVLATFRPRRFTPAGSGIATAATEFSVTVTAGAWDVYDKELAEADLYTTQSMLRRQQDEKRAREEQEQIRSEALERSLQTVREQMQATWHSDQFRGQATQGALDAAAAQHQAAIQAAAAPVNVSTPYPNDPAPPPAYDAAADAQIHQGQGIENEGLQIRRREEDQQVEFAQAIRNELGWQQLETQRRSVEQQLETLTWETAHVEALIETRHQNEQRQQQHTDLHRDALRVAPSVAELQIEARQVDERQVEAVQSERIRELLEHADRDHLQHVAALERAAREHIELQDDRLQVEAQLDALRCDELRRAQELEELHLRERRVEQELEELAVGTRRLEAERLELQETERQHEARMEAAEAERLRREEELKVLEDADRAHALRMVELEHERVELAVRVDVARDDERRVEASLQELRRTEEQAEALHREQLDQIRRDEDRSHEERLQALERTEREYNEWLQRELADRYERERELTERLEAERRRRESQEAAERDRHQRAEAVVESRRVANERQVELLTERRHAARSQEQAREEQDRLRDRLADQRRRSAQEDRRAEELRDERQRDEARREQLAAERQRQRLEIDEELRRSGVTPRQPADTSGLPDHAELTTEADRLRGRRTELEAHQAMLQHRRDDILSRTSLAWETAKVLGVGPPAAPATEVGASSKSAEATPPSRNTRAQVTVGRVDDVAGQVGPPEPLTMASLLAETESLLGITTSQVEVPIEDSGEFELSEGRLFGMPLRNVEAIARIAEAHSVVIDVRPTNPESLKWLEKGALAKPETFKAKTINEVDVELGFLAEDVGKVGFRDLGVPPLKCPPDLSEAAYARWIMRHKLFAADTALVAALGWKDGDGDAPEHRIGPHGVVLHRATGRCYAGDHDLYRLRYRSGGIVTDKALIAKLLSELKAYGVEHGAHLAWKLGGAGLRKHNPEKFEAMKEVFISIVNGHRQKQKVRDRAPSTAADRPGQQRVRWVKGESGDVGEPLLRFGDRGPSSFRLVFGDEKPGSDGGGSASNPE